MVLHLATSRSSLVRLSPVADALAELGVPSVLLDPTAPADRALRVASGGPPHTRAFVASERRADPGTEGLMATVEDALERLRPTLVMVAGDSDATVAGALTASRSGVPVARVGAGLRCDDWGLREEIARVVLDSVADRLYTDGPDATMTLAADGIGDGRVEEVGSTLADSVLRWRERAAGRAAWRTFGLTRGRYVLATIHRDENLADMERVSAMTAALAELARRSPMLLVLHPRTRAVLGRDGHLETLRSAGGTVTGPLDYLDFLSLEHGAGAVLTDSAGVQEEATVLGVPCFTLRRASERTLTLTHGTNVLLGDDPREIESVSLDGRREPWAPIPRWDGQAGQRIAAHVLALPAADRAS